MSEERNQEQVEEQNEEEVDEAHEQDVDLGHAFRRDIESDEFTTERPEHDPEHDSSDTGQASDENDERVDNEGNKID